MTIVKGHLCSAPLCPGHDSLLEFCGGPDLTIQREPTLADLAGPVPRDYLPPMTATRSPEALTFERISAINEHRALAWHPRGLDSWSLSDWAVALAGEVGELCNVVKKLNRIRDGLAGNKVADTEATLRAELEKEAADVYLYLDLFAAVAGFSLPDAVRSKFNETSERLGLPHRL